ncbi:hypothetical protein XM48_00030 [Leucobacter sp. Ag1]|nr:hypothetical protein XM48_00030 [Leucobacter sp. Ag1]
MFFHRRYYWSYWYSFRRCFFFFLVFYLHRFSFCLYTRSCFYFSFIYFGFLYFSFWYNNFRLLLNNLWLFFFCFNNRRLGFGFLLFFHLNFSFNLYRCFFDGFWFLLNRFFLLDLTSASIQCVKINFTDHLHTTLMSRLLYFCRSSFLNRRDFYRILDQDFLGFIMIFEILILR